MRGLRITARVLSGVVLLLLVFVLFQPNTPHTRAEIRHLTGLLNESAAISVPHHSLMEAEMRAQYLALLEKVERGAVLDGDESRLYRMLYQQVLKGNQWKLALFDRELTVHDDFSMDRPNNLGGFGIAGAHDHHDHSAERNFAGLLDAMQRIENSGGLFGGYTRVVQANRAYKGLSDIILHMATAPHTVSVMYKPSGFAAEDPLRDAFDNMMQSYKDAQFAPVNSSEYWAHVEAAMVAYDELVWLTQSAITSRLSSFEQRLAGRWLALHTLSPAPDDDLVLRFPRH